MMITLVSPILLFVSSYSLGTVVTLALVKFSVFFWAFLFALASWLDNYLLEAVASAGGDGSSFLWQMMSENADGGAADNSVVVIGYITRSLYLLLPMVFTSMMAWAGVQAGTAVKDLGGPNAGGAGSAGPKPKL